MTPQPTRLQQLSAEFLGTFMLVFVGTGAVVANDASQGAVTHVGVAICFGLVVAAMIYSVGNISGAHINPAVTIALWLAKRFPARNILPYIVAQCLGAFAASGVVLLTFGSHETLGATLPDGTWQQSFVLEVVITFMLMFVILNSTSAQQDSSWLAGAAIGGTVALAAMFAGPICGASMNPARSIGPAIVGGNLQHLWVYIAAPILGALLAVPGCRCVQGSPCCAAGNCD